VFEEGDVFVPRALEVEGDDQLEGLLLELLPRELFYSHLLLWKNHLNTLFHELSAAHFGKEIPLLAERNRQNGCWYPLEQNKAEFGDFLVGAL
jgi:hypothetical protein